MYVVRPAPVEIRLVWRSGEFLAFRSMAAAAREAKERGWLSYRCGFLGDAFGHSRWLDGLAGQALARKTDAPHVVCRTSHGEAVEIRQLLAETARVRRFVHRFAEFRRDPVAYTGKGSAGTGFRWPRTFREIREREAYESDVRDLRGCVRKIGRVRPIPTAYDDLLRHAERSWKRFRSHQYRQSKDLG